MKYSKANTVHTQQFIAQYGKAARYPLCLAALGLWRLDAELSEQTKKVAQAWELVNSVKQQRKEAIWLIDQLYKEQKQKEVPQASAILRNVDKLLPEVQKCFQATAKLWLHYDEWRELAAVQFERERVAAKGDTKARKALQRVRKRWNDKKAFLGDSDRRTLEILKMLRAKASDQVTAKDGANARYLEAARGGSRPLSDKAWQGLLTASEIQSRLVDAPVERDAKEVRRLAKKLGILLAEDQRGRKRKPYLRKQKPKRPRGRPRTKAELVFKGDIAQAFDELVRESRGRAPRRPSKDQFWDSSEARRTAARNRSANL